MPKTPQETFLDWFHEKLDNEKLSMDLRHQSLREDMKLKIEALWANQGMGLSAGPSAAPLEIAGGAPLGNAPEEAKDLSQITPKDIVATEPKAQPKDNPSQAIHTSKPKVLIDHHFHASTNIVERIVFHKKFEWTFGFIIVIHIFVMCIESQYVGIGVGHDIGYPNYESPREEVWPAGEAMFFVLDFIFGSLYTVELVLKILALRLHFLEAWNVLDVVIVGLWYVEKLTANVKLPIDTMLLRLLRLAKLLRLVKVLKSLSGFDQLFLMLTALRGSFRILCWVACILFTCLIAFALLSNQLLVGNILENPDVTLESKRRCFEFFGTFSRALFSMFEMTLANYTIMGRFLMDDVDELAGMATIVYKLTMGFTVVAVINACFIKETFKIAERDDLLMVLEKDKERRIHAAKMMKLLDMADTKGDGTLTRQEFINICHDPEVDKWLGAQGLRVTDAGAIFDLIDSGAGLVHKEELVAGARRLQGMSRSLDVAKNHLQITKNHADLQGVVHSVHSQLKDHSDVLRSLHRAMPPVSTACSTEMPVEPPTSVQGIGDFKQELALVMDEVREVKNMLATANLQALSTRMQPLQPPGSSLLAQPPSVLLNSNKKTMWGCT